MTRIKICGLTREEDAIEAARLGADFLGLIFVPSSPRFVEPERAGAIAAAVREAGHAPKFVGVFHDASADYMHEIASIVGLDLFQLHGSEADDYLLAHEMSVAAVAQGYKEARWLVAASEDRFLMKIGRKQRFGTQYEPGDEPGRFRLAPTEPHVTDALREVLGIESLAVAKATASQFDKK